MMNILMDQKLQHGKLKEFMVKSLKDQKLKQDDGVTNQRESIKNNREQFRTCCLPSENSRED